MIRAQNRELLRLAIPNIISNIMVPVNGIIDLAILGHVGSMPDIGALALGGLIFNFIYWNFAFLRMGASGLSAQAYGADDIKELNLVLYRGLCFALLGGLLLIALQTPVFRIAEFFIEGSDAVMSLTAEYFFIRIYAAPATIGIYALTGWYIGVQDSMTPMRASILVNIVNVILNLIFVLEFDMLIDGVAFGTLIAQYAGLIFLLVYMNVKHKNHIDIAYMKLSVVLKGMRRFFTINADIFLRTLTVIVVMSFFTSKSAAHSDEILAINTILLQYFLVFSFFIDGFAYAAEALVGKYIGADEKSKLRNVVRLVFKWGFGVSIIISLVFFIGDEEIINLLTDDRDLVEQSKPYLIWVKLIPLAAFAAFVWDGVYIGATKTKLMRNSLFIAGAVFFTIYYFLYPETGNHGIWIAFYGYMISRGIYQWIYSRRIFE